MQVALRASYPARARRTLLFGRGLRFVGVGLMVGSIAGAGCYSGAATTLASTVIPPVLALARVVSAVLPHSIVATSSVTPSSAPNSVPSAARSREESSESVGLADRFYKAVRLSEYARAVVYGRQYLDRNPQANEFAMDLANAYIALGDYEAARSILYARTAYLLAHPSNASLWLNLAYKEGARRHYVRSIDDLDQYLQYRPNDVAALRQRKFDVASITPAPPDLSVAFYAAVKEKRYREALADGNAYLAAHPDNDAFAIDLAYADIAAGKLDAAETIAAQRTAYFRASPSAAKLLADLFYALRDRKEFARAMIYGEQYLALNPGDNAFAMDLAYAYLSDDNVEAARALAVGHAAYFKSNPKAATLWMDISYKDAANKEYRRAAGDVDAYLSFDPGDASATAQRTSYVEAYWGGPRYQNYGYTQYEQRFADVFFGMDQTFALAPPKRVQPYVGLYLTEDTRSGAPGSPQIYSDNALIADVGLRVPVGTNVTAFVEGGAGVGLRGQGTITDLRYGVRYFEQWAARPGSYTTVDASAAFYSRYGGNFISYYSVDHDFGGRIIRPLIGINGGLDSHNQFGNNFIEGIAGFQAGTPALSFQLLQVEGTYLTRGLNPAPKAPYTSLRANLFFGFVKNGSI